MFTFSSEKTERHFIPKEYRMEIYELFDRCQTGGRKEKFALWAKIQKIFPELDFVNNDWSLDTLKILSPYIYRK